MNTRKNPKGPAYYKQMAQGATAAVQASEDLPSKPVLVRSDSADAEPRRPKTFSQEYELA